MGNNVDILGVPVGEVTKVTPGGTSVAVRMRVPARLKIPASASALIIPPTVITDRYVELTPAYRTGPALADGGEIPLARTRTPVEFDRIVRAIDSLATSLNKDAETTGAIRDALGVAAKNLGGNGLRINRSIQGLSAAVGSLAENQDDLTGLIRSLDTLTATFAANDTTIRAFSKDVTAATAVLAANGPELDATIAALTTALTEVGDFVRRNQKSARAGIGSLCRSPCHGQRPPPRADGGPRRPAADVPEPDANGRSRAAPGQGQRPRRRQPAESGDRGATLHRPRPGTLPDRPAAAVRGARRRPASAGPVSARAGAGLAAVAVLLSACATTMQDLPRPGGNFPGPSYVVTAVFADALNLPDGAHVRVDGVEVGRVEDISTRDFRARVRIRLPLAVVLTEAATAELRMTTPLGEGFIELRPGAGKVRLADGAVLGAARTSTVANVEDMLSAASTLLTGGGLAQLRTVVTELNKAIDGRKGETKSLLASLTTFLKTFNDRTADIDRALKGLDTLSSTLVERRSTIDAALTDIAPAAELLADQTAKFTEVLARVTKLGATGKRVVERTRKDLLATLRDLEPVLDALIAVEKDIGPTLRQLVRFGEFLDSAVPGDYLTGDINLSNVTVVPEAGGASAPPVSRGVERVPDMSLRGWWSQ